MTLSKSINLSVLVLILFSALCITFNFSSFMEGFSNGFYTMQTPFETVASFIGNISFYLVKLF